MEVLQYINMFITLPIVVYVISLEKRLTTLNTKMDMFIKHIKI